MKVEYVLSKQDYIDFNVYHAKNSKVIKKSLFLQRYIVPIIFLVMPFPLTRVTDIPLWYWFATFSLTTVIWVTFYPKHVMSVARKRISKMVDEGKNKDLLGKHCIIVDEEGIVNKSQNSESRINWGGVERLVSIESHFFIYVSSISAYIIPKSSFENESSEDVFLKFVKRMIENNERMKDNDIIRE